MDVGFNNSGAVPYTPKEVCTSVVEFTVASSHMYASSWSASCSTTSQPYIRRPMSVRVTSIPLLRGSPAVQTFSHALYTLATNPENIAPLREEMDAIINAEGLTKTSLLKMHKVDSFLRESTRANCMLGSKCIVIVSLTILRLTVISDCPAVCSPVAHIQRWNIHPCRHLPSGPTRCRPSRWEHI
jgi:hypothetical protein